MLGAPPVEAVASGRALARATGWSGPRTSSPIRRTPRSWTRQRLRSAGARRPRERARPVAGRPRRRAGARAGIPRASRARVPSHCSRIRARRRSRSSPPARARRRHGRGGARGSRRGVRLRRRARRDRPVARRDGAARVAAGNARVPRGRRRGRGAARRGGVRRIVASGNGAAYYVAVALWLASLEGRAARRWSPCPAACWRAAGSPGGRATSCSPSRRRASSATSSRRSTPGAPAPYAAVTASPDSTLGSRAGARALVSVPNQRAVTHTQAFCGAVAAALAVWAEGHVRTGARERVRGLPRSSGRRASPQARAWVDELAATSRREAAIVFGSGPGWAAALEAALLLKEVAGHPGGGSRDPRGGDVGDDGARGPAPRAQPADRRR